MFGAIDNWLLDPTGLTPHGFCLLWQPGLIWTYAISDGVIALSYFSIPLALAAIARQRKDLVFRPLLWLFAAFIMLCGATHWLDIVTLWLPAYTLGDGQGRDRRGLAVHRLRAVAAAAAGADLPLARAIPGGERAIAGEPGAALPIAEDGDRRPAHRRHRA